ncbi:MAG: carbonic anhydrase [Methyloceanibacter sp.]|uniref:carbonic anhydrase n=1 Tax=Methyloceanibacter sp. TaxID=1965321 RepID=UPI003EDF38E0
MCGNCDSKVISRRGLMAGAGTLLAASALAIRLSHAAEEKPAPNAIAPSEALDRLKQGNARYRAGEFNERDYFAGRDARASAQYPIVAVLACADSRVPPEIVFDQGPGEVFVVRDAGNVVSNYGLASLEFAVAVLNVRLIFVLGHSSCGAVAAALQSVRERKKLPGHLPELVEEIQPAVIAAHGKHASDLLAATINENVRLGMRELKSRSDIIGKAVSSGKVGIQGGVYELATGDVNLI